MLLHFKFIKLGTEKTEALFLILELGAFILAGCHNAGGNMGHADSRACLVDMLAAGTAGAVVVHPHIVHVKVHLHVIINFRHHIYGGEGCMTAFCRIEWRNTHQAVHPFFRFQEAIGILPLHHVFCTLNARFIARKHIQLFQLKSFRLCPFHVHANQHFRPVLGFCAAGTGMEGKYGIILIILAGQKEFNFLLIHDFLHFIELFGNFRLHGLVILFDGQIQDILQSFCPIKKFGIGLIGILCFRGFLGNFAGLVRIIPEAGITHLNVVTSNTFLQLR